MPHWIPNTMSRESLYFALIQAWRWSCREVFISHLTGKEFERWNDLPKATPQVEGRIRNQVWSAYPLVHVCQTASLWKFPIVCSASYFCGLFEHLPHAPWCRPCETGHGIPLFSGSIGPKELRGQKLDEILWVLSLCHNYTNLPL